VDVEACENAGGCGWADAEEGFKSYLDGRSSLVESPKFARLWAACIVVGTRYLYEAMLGEVDVENEDLIYISTCTTGRCIHHTHHCGVTMDVTLRLREIDASNVPCERSSALQMSRPGSTQGPLIVRRPQSTIPFHTFPLRTVSCSSPWRICSES